LRRLRRGPRWRLRGLYGRRPVVPVGAFGRRVISGVLPPCPPTDSPTESERPTCNDGPNGSLHGPALRSWCDRCAHSRSGRVKRRGIGRLLRGIVANAEPPAEREHLENCCAELPLPVPEDQTDQDRHRATPKIAVIHVIPHGHQRPATPARTYPSRCKCGRVIECCGRDIGNPPAGQMLAPLCAWFEEPSPTAAGGQMGPGTLDLSGVEPAPIPRGSARTASRQEKLAVRKEAGWLCAGRGGWEWSAYWEQWAHCC
jgi:hypothetical protein